MHLEKASYEELIAFQSKIEERLKVVKPKDVETAHMINLMKLIDNGQMLEAVKLHKHHANIGLKEAKDYVDGLKQSLSILKTKVLDSLLKENSYDYSTSVRHTLLSPPTTVKKI